LKAKLERNRETAALFDIGRYTFDLEAAYTKMWQHPRP
jgi:predicted O-linked N-acetylglucosamine transferase (SPINDLY family)